MAGAEWVRWLFAAVFAALTVFYLARLCTPHRDASAWGGTAHRGVDASRGVMSLGMVAMLVPWVDPLPRLYWQVVFGVAAGHIAVRLIRRQARPPRTASRHRRPGNGVHAGGDADRAFHGRGMEMAAMGSRGMGSAGTALPALTWVFIAYFLGGRGAVGCPAGDSLDYGGNEHRGNGHRGNGHGATDTGATDTGATDTEATEALAIAALGSGTRGVVISPHLLGSSELVMATGMSYMLLTML